MNDVTLGMDDLDGALSVLIFWERWYLALAAYVWAFLIAHKLLIQV